MNAKGISGNQLQIACGLNNSALTKWKKGTSQPSADALKKIADYFEVSVDYLLGRTNDTTYEIDNSVKKILALIKERGINARQLNIACGLNHSSVYNWQNGRGKPKRETIKKIAEYFGKPLSFFYEDCDTPTETQGWQSDFFEGLTEAEIKQLKDYRDLLIAARKKD